jgi:toxin ParE1/3/4
MKIIWTELALKRVQDIANYIADDKPVAAKKWIEKIFNKTAILSQFPEIGRKISETNSARIRELIFGNYRIIYRFDKSKILILTVRHVKQILPMHEIY